MKAAVVTDFNQAPMYQETTLPLAQSNEVVVDVLAASVNQVVMAKANGTHYSSEGQLPLIPGVDGVGKTADGQLVYFVGSKPRFGTLAEQVVTDAHYVMPLPADATPSVVAATVNPAMSSYMAITARLGQEQVQGKKVLVLGATGNAGRLAITISKLLGASTTIAVGRNAEELRVSEADLALNLTDTDFEAQLGQVSDVDVVLDYLWGDVTARVMPALLKQRQNHHQLLNWVEIGSLAGSSFAFPAAALRSTALSLIGSGQGSFSAHDLATYLPKLLTLISDGTLQVPVTAYPLSTVHENRPTETTNRIVFVTGD